MSAIAAEYCLDCGWEHANLAGCWRKALREARETLTRPDLDPEIRAELQAAAEALALHRGRRCCVLRGALRNCPGGLLMSDADRGATLYGQPALRGSRP